MASVTAVLDVNDEKLAVQARSPALHEGVSALKIKPKPKSFAPAQAILEVSSSPLCDRLSQSEVFGMGLQTAEQTSPSRSLHSRTWIECKEITPISAALENGEALGTDSESETSATIPLKNSGSIGREPFAIVLLYSS